MRDVEPRKRLEEKDFIREEYGRNPFPLLRWLGVILFVALLFFVATRFYYSTLTDIYDENPFLQVTNRELSLFLWQNPHHMRVHVKHKNGYLPAFEYAEKIALIPQYADDYAIAPPELFFLYHTWKRLLGDSVIPRAIPADEFRKFLTAAPEWAPEYWKKAPDKYVAFVNGLSSDYRENLSELSMDILPSEVRQAFIGWKNYFFEGDRINALQPTVKLVNEFLAAYPHYARNHWSNIVGDAYLKNIDVKSGEAAMVVSSHALAPFLKVALFNFSEG